MNTTGMTVRDFTADVVVVGGGTAGSAAAVAAARRGRRVILVEQGNCLGGVSTQGGVHEWFASLDGLGDIFDHLRTGLQRFDAFHETRFYEPEYLKLLWQLLAEECGVKLLLHTTLASCTAADGRVQGITVASCGQQRAIYGDWFIDAGGEGALSAAAGASFEQGDPQGGRVLHMSLTFTLRDTGKPVRPWLPPGLEPIESEADLPGLMAYHTFRDDWVYCNMTKVMGCDPTDPESLTAAECEARRQLARVLHWLQRHRLPNHRLAASAARIGIREGRRIVGEKRLTERDILEGGCRNIPDGIAVATSQIDFHSLTRPGNEGWRQGVEPYAIPFGCLVPRGFANLLVAGKCISGDQVAQSSYRMTPTCCAMGQAAGTAAALAHEGGLASIGELDITALRRQLAADGMELDPSRHRPFSGHASPREEAQ